MTQTSVLINQGVPYFRGVLVKGGSTVYVLKIY